MYDQGYGKDAAGIAKAAIRTAAREGTDVVLVDTAGRMQDNTPLMQSLAKLIATNNPDLVLFVGEALGTVVAALVVGGEEGKERGRDGNG